MAAHAAGGPRPLPRPKGPDRPRRPAFFGELHTRNHGPCKLVQGGLAEAAGIRVFFPGPMDRFARFNQDYYDRFYLQSRSRVTSAEEHAHLARFVFEFAKYNGIEIESVLDVGAGVGHWKRWIEKNAKKTSYRGTEVSDAMCKEHGFEKRDIARWRDRETYDLIICQGVLQYLPDPDVAPAIANIAAMSRGLVYFEITTRFDLKERCDTERTDLDIFVRNGSYYRTILQKHFVQVGGGLWWTKEITPPFFELEMAGSAK